MRDRRVKVRWAELDEGHDVWKDIDSDVTAYAARSNKVMSCRPSPPGVTAAALLHGLHAAKPSNEEPSNVESAAHHALASLVQAADTAAEEARAAVEPYGTAQYSSSFDGIPHYVGPPPLSSLPPTQLYPILSQLQVRAPACPLPPLLSPLPDLSPPLSRCRPRRLSPRRSSALP